MRYTRGYVEVSTERKDTSQRGVSVDTIFAASGREGCARTLMGRVSCKSPRGFLRIRLRRGLPESGMLMILSVTTPELVAEFRAERAILLADDAIPQGSCPWRDLRGATTVWFVPLFG